MTNAEPSPADAMMIARDADEVGRRADAIKILITQGGLSLAAALDELTPMRMPQVGDILECSWGYEQTRVDFYQVTKTTAKTVTVREIAKRYVSRGQHGQGSVMPIADAFVANEKPLTGRHFRYVSACWHGRYMIRITDYSHAYLWDGEACSESGDH